MSDCPHCEHYAAAEGQMFDTAIALDETEDRLYRVGNRLKSTAEALVWCLARLDQRDVPAWVRCALDEAEAPA